MWPKLIDQQPDSLFSSPRTIPCLCHLPRIPRYCFLFQAHCFFPGLMFLLDWKATQLFERQNTLPSCPCFLTKNFLQWNISFSDIVWFSEGILMDTSVFSSVQLSRWVMSNSLQPHEPQPGLPVHHQLPESTQTHVHWVSDAIQPIHPVVPFPSCRQSFPASGSFQMSQLFASDGQTIGVSASKSVLPMNSQDWSPLGWTGCISLQSKGLSRVFSNTTVQKHRFFGAQLSL